MLSGNTLTRGRPRNSRVSPDQQVSGQKVGSREERLDLQGPLPLPLPFPVLLPLSHRGLPSKHMCVPHHDVQNKILKHNRGERRKVREVCYLSSAAVDIELPSARCELERGVGDKV